MTEQIIDGTGSGYRAKVGSDNQLHVVAATVPYQHHVAHKHQQAFFITIQQTPSGANTAFAYLKNLDSIDLNLWSIGLRAASAEVIELWSVTGIAAGTAYDPVNVMVGSGLLADTTCIVGTGVTGLTKSKLLKRYWVEAAKETDHHEILSAVIIKQSQAIALYAVTGSIQIDVDISFDFHEVE